MLGELVLRFDSATLFFQGSRFQELESEAVPSGLRTALEEDRFEASDGQLRIMLLGDSILYRRALPPDKAFSCVLEDRLGQSILAENRDVLVLDLLTPGVGTTQLMDLYFEFADAFRPHIVFWAYNRSDILQVGMRGAPKPGPVKSIAEPNPNLRDRLRVSTRNMKLWVTTHSEVFGYLNRNFTRELKAQGIVLPGGRFEFMLKRSHQPDYGPWQKTKEHFAEVKQRCIEHDSHLLVMITPLLDILSDYDLVAEMDRDLVAAFQELGVDCMNGVDPFIVDPKGDYSVSRYDGHPNAKGHRMLAEAVVEHLVARFNFDPDARSRDECDTDVHR